MKTLWISLIGFVFILNTRGGLCDSCDFDAFSQCLESTRIEEDFYGLADTYPLKKVSRDMLESYCSIYNNEIRDCLAGSAQTCSGYYGAMFRGSVDAFDYLCNEGFEGYIKHLDCFGSNRTETKMTGCLQQAALGYYSMAFDFSEKKACSVLDDGLDCIVDSIEDVCGKDASEWVDTFSRKMADPIMDEMGCKHMNVATLVGIIVGSVVGAAALLTCVCCICAAVRKQRMNAPPPYSRQTDVVQSPVPTMAGENVGPLPSYIETCQGLPVKQV